jgi:integrase
MVVHIQDGKGHQDRDVMLSPVLLEELRAHWRRLRKKSDWLFPGNRWHSGDHPTDDGLLHILELCRHARLNVVLSQWHLAVVRPAEEVIIPKRHEALQVFGL